MVVITVIVAVLNSVVIPQQVEKSKYAAPLGWDSPTKGVEGRIRLPTEPLTPMRTDSFADAPIVCEAEC